jgi:hypothetical protein
MRTLLLSLALVSAALADEVVLKNGSAFSGVVREEGDRVIVEMDFGTMSFKKVDVRTISRNGEDLLSQFQQKVRTATDVKSMMELAAWARDKGLTARAAELYRKVLVLDPDQAEARKALGYERVNGLWLTGDELMTARGFVKVGGRWMAKDTAQQVLDQEAAARIENDRLAQLRRESDQRHEQEMTKIALERERLELEKRMLEEGDRWWWRHGGWAYAPGPFGGVAGYILPAAVASQAVPLTPPSVVPLGPPSPVGPSRPR